MARITTLLLFAAVATAMAFAPTATVRAQEGTDLPGMDLAPGFDLRSDSPALCKKACDENPQCQAWTYVRPGVQGPKARCWLKSGVPAAVKSKCCTSGVRGGPTPLTPIQLPGAKAPAAPAQVAAGSRTIDAATLKAAQQRTSMAVTRGDMIGALASSPLTQGELQKIADSMRMSTMTLTTTTLAGDVVAAAAAQYKAKYPTYAEIWKAPLVIPLTKASPQFDAGSSMVLAVAEKALRGVYFPTTVSLPDAISSGTLIIGPNGDVEVFVDLPEGGGQYMIAVQAVNQWDRASGLVNGVPSPILTGFARSWPNQQTVDTPLTFVPTSTDSALVALWTDPPTNAGTVEGPQTMQRCSLHLTLAFADFAFISSVTVTRL